MEKGGKTIWKKALVTSWSALPFFIRLFSFPYQIQRITERGGFIKEQLLNFAFIFFSILSPFQNDPKDLNILAAPNMVPFSQIDEKQTEPEKQNSVSNRSGSKIEDPLSEKSEKDVKSFSSTGLSKQSSEQLYDITQQELDMIAAVVMHEVGHCSRESKVAVTNVILNRLKDGRFGDSIYDILHQPNQFSAISNYYTPTIPADGACYEAVSAALPGRG